MNFNTKSGSFETPLDDAKIDKLKSLKELLEKGKPLLQKEKDCRVKFEEIPFELDRQLRKTLKKININLKEHWCKPESI